MKKQAEIEDWSGRYSEPRLWDKVRHRSLNLARRPVEMGLTLYYTLQSPGTPLWCKGVISGSLGYFISLIDAIPDLTPVLGYTDDISVMAAALAMLGAYVTPQIHARAKQTTDRLFSNRAQDQPEKSSKPESENHPSTNS